LPDLLDGVRVFLAINRTSSGANGRDGNYPHHIAVAQRLHGVGNWRGAVQHGRSLARRFGKSELKTRFTDSDRRDVVGCQRDASRSPPLMPSYKPTSSMNAPRSTRTFWPLNPR
jgi:hypothetical protein